MSSAAAAVNGPQVLTASGGEVHVIWVSTFLDTVPDSCAIVHLEEDLQLHTPVGIYGSMTSWMHMFICSAAARGAPSVEGHWAPWLLAWISRFLGLGANALGCRPGYRVSSYVMVRVLCDSLTLSSKPETLSPNLVSRHAE